MRNLGLPLEKHDERYTYRDYCQWPDDERWELIDGVAYNMSPAPTTKHQGLAVSSVIEGFQIDFAELFPEGKAP
ncbi:MAG: hypothetical protein WCG80_19115 [Spirochaetales bacterium]